MQHWSSRSSKEQPGFIRHFALALGISLGFLALLLLAYYKWNSFITSPLRITSEKAVFEIPKGASVKWVARVLHNKGYIESPLLFEWLVQSEGKSRSIQAGEYLIEPGMNPLTLLENIHQGKVVQHAFTIIEGWNFRELMDALAKEPALEHTLENKPLPEITQILGLPFADPEGLFYPDTYFFSAHTKDVDFLKRASSRLMKELDALWNERLESLPFSSPYEALIMASIVEKETAVSDERFEIAGVYVRRLFKNMRLQADPTVNYALKKPFHEPLTKKDLKVESPYNTYQVQGLPPTPIAIPSIGSLQATLKPTPSNTLYFVATGEGGHVFSETLEAHQKAVKKYRKKRKQNG